MKDCVNIVFNRSMAGRWVLEREEIADSKITLSAEEEYTIGRGKENKIKCLSLYVSRRHSQIIPRNGQLAIVDLKSANGTYVNKTQILPEREIPLQDGDCIGFGVCEITNADCYVYRLKYEHVQDFLHTPMPDSSTRDEDLINISDSDENEVLENGEDQVKGPNLKRPADQEDNGFAKIPRLENSRNQQTLASNSRAMGSSHNDMLSSVVKPEPSSLEDLSLPGCENSKPSTDNLSNKFEKSQKCGLVSVASSSTIDSTSIQTTKIKLEEEYVPDFSRTATSSEKTVYKTSPTVPTGRDDLLVSYLTAALDEEVLLNAQPQLKSTLLEKISKIQQLVKLGHNEDQVKDNKGTNVLDKTVFLNESNRRTVSTSEIPATENVEPSTSKKSNVKPVEENRKKQEKTDKSSKHSHERDVGKRKKYCNAEKSVPLTSIDSKRKKSVNKNKIQHKNEKGSAKEEVVVVSDSSSGETSNVNTSFKATCDLRHEVKMTLTNSTKKKMQSDEPYVNNLEIIPSKSNKHKPHRRRIASVSSDASDETGKTGKNMTNLSSRKSSDIENTVQQCASHQKNNSDSSSGVSKQTVTSRKGSIEDKFVEQFTFRHGNNSDSNSSHSNLEIRTTESIHSANPGSSRITEMLANFSKKEPIVILERLSEDKLTSSLQDSQLNYTLDEDIIVISDDDEYFPASQIFDEINCDIQVKTEKDIDESFEKAIDDDNVVFEEDEELDEEEKGWYSLLSQDINESTPDSECKKKPIEKIPPGEPEEKDITINEDHDVGMRLECPLTHNKTETNEMEDDVFLKSNEKTSSNQKEPLYKTKLLSKSMLIDAPPMPPRKASQRGISAGEATRMYKERQDKSIQQTKSKASTFISSDTRVPKKKQKQDLSFSIGEETILSTTEKKQLQDIRKEKLKAISEKEKEIVAQAALSRATKVPAKARIKVTERNRGAFLTEGADGSSIAKISKEKKSNLKEKSSVDSLKFQPKKHDLRSASVPTKSITNLPRIPKISERPSTSKSLGQEWPPLTTTEMDSVLANAPVPQILTSALPDFPIIKTLAPTICNTKSSKSKKKVRFKDDSDLVQVHFIPVEENARMIPVNHKKDAPPPSKKAPTVPCIPKGPVLDEVLHDILCWNPKWLECPSNLETEQGVYGESTPQDQQEQKLKPAAEPPPVAGSKVWPMLTTFASYDDYLKVLTPLILLDLWSNVTKETVFNPHEPRKSPVIVGIDKVDRVPYLTPNQKQLMFIGCHAVLTEVESQRSQHPRIGDLVYLELELENQLEHQQQQQGMKRRMIPIFAYVVNLYKETVTPKTIAHREVLKPMGAWPACKLNLVLMTKFRPYDVKTTHAMRLKVISYIKSDLRLFQAMAYLPMSPLCNHILQPERQDFSLPDTKDAKLSPLINQDRLNDTQKKAILQTALACLKPQPNICMIQGPPGTGKTYVIVNLILQILYGQRSYRKHGSRKNNPRILLCAPSNAAADELVLRLLTVRQKINKEDRFKMVRIGRQETMNPQVKDISLLELAKRDVRATSQNMEAMESVELEIRNLEALRNSKKMALESAKKKNLEKVHDLESKLRDIEKKLAQMRNSKLQNFSVPPQDLARMEWDAQNRILVGADIVATTLSSCFSNQMENIYLRNKDSGFQFTCCIVDEATQSQELETLIPLMLGVTTLVLVGDAKQLPATVLSKVAKDYGLGKSLFARLHECFEETVRNPVQFLGIQYRMHPDICHWPNRFFYNSRLHSAPNLAQRSCPLVPYCILSLEYKQNDNGELLNTGEAELVSQLTLGILEKLGDQHFSIGIITPYHKQRTAILSFLQSHHHNPVSVEVNTIDSFQGQERDIIVMSSVRTGGVGFLADTQRLNVALTRARHSLLLCGNFTSLRVGNDSMWRALLENAQQRKVFKHVTSSEARNKEKLLQLVLREST